MFKAAIIQFEPVLGDVDKNIRIIRQKLTETKDSKLVVLPELASRIILDGFN